MAARKQWYEIVTPKMFGEKVIGETPAADPRQLVGRTIEASLMEISKDFQRFYVKLVLQITDVSGQRAHTKFLGHDTMYERIYRMVQRHTRRVDVIQVVTTKDGVKIKVKSIFILARRVNTSIKKDARALAREIIDAAAKESTMEDFIGMVIKGDLQQKIREDCSKIYPVGNVEVRKTEILQGKRAAAPAA